MFPAFAREEFLALFRSKAVEYNALHAKRRRVVRLEALVLC
jgi:hypothetical protein